MKMYYKDFYGATASIRVKRDGGAVLKVFCGGKWFVKEYKTVKGAKIALSKWSDCWQKV